MKNKIIGYKSLKECVYSYLRKELETGDLKPGTTIVEKSISEKFNISRTPIREALIQLELEGFITILPRRRIYVNELKEKDIENMYQVIEALESNAAMNALDKITEKDMVVLQQLYTKIKKSLNEGKHSQYMKYCTASHDFLLKLNNNELLNRTVKLLRMRICSYTKTNKKNPIWNFQLMEHHRKMIELCEKKDKEGIRKLLSDVHCSFEWNHSSSHSYYSRNNFVKT